jgi:hypothetical protein
MLGFDTRQISNPVEPTHLLHTDLFWYRAYRRQSKNSTNARISYRKSKAFALVMMEESAEFSDEFALSPSYAPCDTNRRKD